MRLRLLPLLLLGLGAAGCDTRFNADLGSEPMDGAASVQVAIQGVDIEKDDGSDDNLDRNVTETAELLDFTVAGTSGSGDQLFELIHDAKVKKGTYTGVRIQFAEDEDSSFEGEGLLAGEADDTMTIRNVSEFVPVEFKLKDDDSVSIELVMDLRLSVARLAEDDFELSPSMRAVVSGDEAEVGGTVDESYFVDDDGDDGEVQCEDGAAVYAFEGENVPPKERTSSGDVQPFATTPIVRTGGTGDGTYRFRFMPAGTYTLAVTCDGENENGIEDAHDPDGDRDVVEFRDASDQIIENLQLDEGEQATANFTP